MSYLGTTKIGKMFLGNTGIAKAYLGTNLVFQNGGSPTPPSNISYVRGGVGSYIDTGITADDSTRVIVWARNFNPNSVVLFGSRVGGTNQAFGVFAPSAQYSGSLRFDYGSTQNIVAGAFSKMSGYHKYELDGNKFYVDDTLVGTATSATFENSLNIYLFAINTNGTRDDSALPIDICACKIYKGGNLVRDFSPVQTPFVGLYDEVSGTVFTNAGTGSFSYGTFNPNAYTPLEYIECTKEQYFDSGVYGSNASNVVVKFRLTNSTKTYSRLFGTRNGGDTIMNELMIGNTTTANKHFTARFNATYYTVYNSAAQTNVDLVYVQVGSSLSLYKNNSQLGTTSGSGTFTTEGTMYVGTSNMNGSPGLEYSFYGRIYYIGFDGQHCFAPAEVNGVAGMYDTYNDVFKPSESGTPFVSGPVLT